jgi:hypothetical protein
MKENNRKENLMKKFCAPKIKDLKLCENPFTYFLFVCFFHRLSLVSFSSDSVEKKTQIFALTKRLKNL